MKRSEDLSFKKLTHDEKRSRNLRRLSAGCFIGAVIAVLVMLIIPLPQFQKQLLEINTWFTSIELFIAEFDKFAAVAIIMFFFMFKTVFGCIPFSVLFIGTGLVFSPPIAIAVNVIGFCMLICIKFLWGRKFGGGGLHKLLLKSESLSAFMDFNGKGNKWMLVVLRFIPFAPAGTISRAYGGTDMRLIPFIIFSVLGFLPRLIIWSIIGCNVFDPFTPAFLTPVAMLLVISGVSLLLLDILFKLIRKDDKNEKE